MSDMTWEEGSVDLDGDTIRYRSQGNGPPIVFVHGAWVGGSLRDDMAERLPPSSLHRPDVAPRRFYQARAPRLGDSDKLFPLDHARRPEADFPDATLGVIAGANTFVMIDQTESLAVAIAQFIKGDTER